MPNTTCLSRLQQELKKLQQQPPSDLLLAHDPDNILEWYFCFDGPASTPFAVGEYMGLLRFPPNYPFAPPSVLVLTPNGRFGVNTRICMTMTDYHPESWTPAWNALTIARGLISFMVEVDSFAAGTVQMTDEQRMLLAQRSRENNRKNAIFNQLFAAKRDEMERRKREGAAAAASATVAAVNTTAQVEPKGRAASALVERQDSTRENGEKTEANKEVVVVALAAAAVGEVSVHAGLRRKRRDAECV